jgi:thiol-disulfide isomerase/thioredoxin
VSKKLRVGSIAPEKLGNVVTFIDEEKVVPIMKEEDCNLVVFLWAQWCAPCHQPLQDFHNMMESNKNLTKDTRVWSICIDNDIEEMTKFIKEK